MLEDDEGCKKRVKIKIRPCTSNTCTKICSCGIYAYGDKDRRLKIEPRNGLDGLDLQKDVPCTICTRLYHHVQWQDKRSDHVTMYHVPCTSSSPCTITYHCTIIAKRSSYDCTVIHRPRFYIICRCTISFPYLPSPSSFQMYKKIEGR